MKIIRYVDERGIVQSKMFPDDLVITVPQVAEFVPVKSYENEKIVSPEVGSVEKRTFAPKKKRGKK